jgi:hypothetical protein
MAVSCPELKCPDTFFNTNFFSVKKEIIINSVHKGVVLTRIKVQERRMHDHKGKTNIVNR